MKDELHCSYNDGGVVYLLQSELSTSTLQYIRGVLAKYGHPTPTKRQLPPHKNQDIVYGTKKKFIPDKDTIPNIDEAGIWRVQGIVGELLYYASAVENKLLMDLSTHQAAATKGTYVATHQLLNYVAKYPNDSQCVWTLYGWFGHLQIIC